MRALLICGVFICCAILCSGVSIVHSIEDDTSLDYMLDVMDDYDDFDEEDDEEDEITDKFEGYNRIVYKFNSDIDQALISPVVELYDNGTSSAFKRSVRNFTHNLREPLNCVNSLLSGDLKQFFTSAARFMLNTTIGVAGIADYASDRQGIAYAGKSFGDVLRKYNVATGPYLVLPFLGASNVRDAIGRVVDFLLDPIGWLLISNGHYGLDIALIMTNLLVERYTIDHAVKMMHNVALDEYIFVRHLYMSRSSE